MRKYSHLTVQTVKDVDIRTFIPGCHRNKGSQTLDCPVCGEKRFSVVHKDSKNFAYCHACKFSLSDAIAACAHYNNIDLKNDWLNALEETARQGGVILIPEEEERKNALQVAKKSTRASFCGQQLESSGLTLEDVMATTYEGSTETLRSPFRPGRIEDGFIPSDSGDEMLIYYYDLHGRPMMYTGRGQKRPREYVRVRWSNPALHKSADGKEMKYQTPAGASCRVYIPEKIRRLYKNKTHIETLFLQEGEKKAEKACKHGMLSIGIQGINNFGSQNEGLLQDIQDIAKTCKIDNIALIMDADWNDLHRNITIGDRADKRPNSFSRAVIKYRQYMRTFHNIGLSVNVWWGHVNENERGDKGVDDLLCGSLLGHEEELMTDIKATMNSHDGRGKWLDIHKITEESDTKIRDFWSLNDVQAFYDIHKDRLKDVDVFKIGSIRYRIENGRIIPQSRYSSDTDIYSITQTSKGEDRVEFNEVEAFRFLSSNGFARLLHSDETIAGFEFIRIEDGIIDRVAPFMIRDFIRDYVGANCHGSLVLNFFYRKLNTLMSDKQLEALPIVADTFNNFAPGVQRTYYNNGQVEITANSITPGQPINQVWRSRIVPRRFKRVPIIKDIRVVDGRFYPEYTEEAEKCEFLRFLINTSNNFFPYNAPREVTEDEVVDWNQHIANKITSLGYLCCDYKYATERKAVIIQDHLMSEVGQSHGGAGKSLIGDALRRILDQFVIDGKSDLRGDKFLLSGVSKSTRNILIDDVKTNFDFEMLFPMITGDMVVNPKGETKYNIRVDESPKILITTNHAINKAEQNASRRRIIYMEFSTWYNPDHTPYDDFGHQFFDDWDDEQWNLFDNLMAECAMYYLRSYHEGWAAPGTGAVPPPMKNIELRTLRQDMSETLYQWAEEYYDPTGYNLNVRLKRRDLYNLFMEFAGGTSGHSVTRSNFKRKLQMYCRFKGYDFNIDKKNSEGLCYRDWKPQHPDETFVGDDDKAGGIEYFTVYSPEKETQLKPF